MSATATLTSATTRTASVRVAEAQVRYDRTGSGPALVLVHGTGSGGSAVNWGQVLPRFTADHTVITLTSPAPSAPWTTGLR